MLSGKPNAFSGIFGPDGRLVSDPLIDDEGIVYGELDMNLCIEPKQYHDIIGAYNRFDIFKLTVDRTPQTPARFGANGITSARASSNADSFDIAAKIGPDIGLG
jgi:hypothetical protein